MGGITGDVVSLGTEATLAAKETVGALTGSNLSGIAIFTASVVPAAESSRGSVEGCCLLLLVGDALAVLAMGAPALGQASEALVLVGPGWLLSDKGALPCLLMVG